MSVSLVRDSDIADPDEADGARLERRQHGAERRAARDREEPAAARRRAALRLGGPPAGGWLQICGEGPLEGELRDRLRELGVEDRAELLGYLPIHGGLMDRYRGANAFLHISWTEGMPQVLLEAFAAGTPVVATAVGGVPEAAGDAALLIPPGDAGAAADALDADRQPIPSCAACWSGAGSSACAAARSRPRARAWRASWPIRTVPSRPADFASAHRFAESSRSAGRAGDPICWG